MLSIKLRAWCLWEGFFTVNVTFSKSHQERFWSKGSRPATLIKIGLHHFIAGIYCEFWKMDAKMDFVSEDNIGFYQYS